MPTREPTALATHQAPPQGPILAGPMPSGYARQAIRLERALGWVLWIALAAVLFLITF